MPSEHDKARRWQLRSPSVIGGIMGCSTFWLLHPVVNSGPFGKIYSH